MTVGSTSSRAGSERTVRRAQRRAAGQAWWSDGRDKSTEVADRPDAARMGTQLRLSEDRHARVALAAALAAMRTGETPEATAGAIGAILVALAGFGAVALFGFEPNGDVVPLASLDRDGRPVTLSGALPPGRVAYLRERASRGPWIEDWHPAPDHPYYAFGVEHAIKVLAYVPIRSEDDVVGLLIVSASAGKEQALAEHEPVLAECAAFAGALLGPQVRSRAATALSEARIRAVIAERAFVPVFQPIVELADQAVVGYEALTRFSDGRPPNDVFAEATRCGLTLDLEAATLVAAVESAGPLQGSAWLNLNVSPELVLAGEPLASIVGACRWPIVLELTEHLPVADYGALRSALDRLGSDVRLAVDDAGAGFASLRHILELRPTYVKLDRAIVHGLHRDAARRALIAGMVHFAGETGAVVIAEGVEAEREARELLRLGVSLGQGYHFGRPALRGPVAQFVPTVVPRPIRQPAEHPDENADDLSRAINVGAALVGALREVGVVTIADLRTMGAVAAWERLRAARPTLATGATLLRLEGATRGIRVTQLPPAERARLRLFVRLGRKAS